MSKDVFVIEDGEKHWYIATNEDDAFALFIGSELNEDDHARDDVLITRLSPTQHVVIVNEDGRRVDKTCEQWCRDEERGFLGSTVY